MPQPSGITLQFQDWVCQKGGAAGGGEENDKEMHRDIHIQQKRKKKERGGKKKKNNTQSLPASKSRSAHILPHKRWHAGEMTKGNADLREILLLTCVVPVTLSWVPLRFSRQFWRWVIAAPGCWIKTGRSPTPLLGKEERATTLHIRTHTYTHFPPLSCPSPTKSNWTL
jgi:hypothetical protein